MNYDQFYASITGATPPAGINVYLRALWLDAKGDWDASHEAIQDVHDQKASWIHAYLHRKEGYTFNANYWYNKANKRMPGYSLEQEWEEIVKAFL
jgi:hypothetical protein